MLAVASLHALDLNVTTSCRQCKSDEAHCIYMPPSFEVKAHAQFQTEQNFRYMLKCKTGKEHVHSDVIAINYSQSRGQSSLVIDTMVMSLCMASPSYSDAGKRATDDSGA